MSDTSLVFNLLLKDNAFAAKLTAVVGAVQSANKETANSAEKVSSSNTRLKASTVAMIAGWTAAIGPGAALASVLGQLASGAALALPAFAATGAAAIGAFGLGVLNLGAAMKTSAVAASGAAFDYAGAEHRVEQALQRSLDAQRSLDEARQDAVRNIDDLGRSLRNATLDEEGAARAVTRAEAELRKAKRGGNRKDIEEADYAYRQSLQTLDDAKHRTQELAEEQADAAERGVDGADAVQQALRQQAEATYELAQAQAALKKGASGGGGGSDPAAEAFAKLAPAAQALVSTVKAIGPAWEDAQRSVQQAVWAGVAGDLRAMSATYIPVATMQLTRFGGAWNIAMRQSAALANTPDTVRQVNILLGNGATAAQTLGRAIAPVVSVLIQMGSAGSGILPALAADALRLAQGFERWITAARQSGQLAAWAQAAYTSLKSVVEIAWNLAAAVVSIFRAGGSSEGQSLLAWLADITGKMAAFLNSTEGQDKIAGFFAAMRGSIEKIGPALADADVSGRPFLDAFKVAGPVLGVVADHIDLLVRLLPYLAAGYLLGQAAQVAANIATAASLPLKAIDVARNWGAVAAMKAHTAALIENTAATGVATPVTVASGTAAAGASGGFWALTAALLANPITWIVLAIIALIAIIVIIATKTTWFQQLWSWAWGGIKTAAISIWKDIELRAGQFWNYLSNVWSYITSLPGKLKTAFGMVTDFIFAPFRAAFNLVASAWNGTIGRLHWTVPGWVPGIGGNSISVPNLPHFHQGGIVPGPPGTEVLAVLQAGERVTPAGDVSAQSGGGGGALQLEVVARGGGSANALLAQLIHALVRTGDLQLRARLDAGGQVAVG